MNKALLAYNPLRYKLGERRSRQAQLPPGRGCITSFQLLWVVNTYRNEDYLYSLFNLRQGRPIQGRVSECHLNVPRVTFTSGDIQRTVKTLRSREGKCQPTLSQDAS